MNIEFETKDPMGPAHGTPHRIDCCGARTRAGGRCGQHPMANGRCYLHGGKSTGPRTAEGLERIRAARTRHGWRGDDGRRYRDMVRDLLTSSKALVEVY